MLSDLAISVENLSKCYLTYGRPIDRLLQMLFRRQKFYNEFWALKNVSFRIKKGATVGIIGRNGSGKSTLLQLICGTLNPNSGDIEINGRVAALLELGSGFNPDFTGRENVYLNASIYGMTHNEINNRFEKIVDFSGIREFIDQPVKTYSSGMALRLAFAVSVNVEADILVIDEALSVGDMAFQQKCYEHLASLQADGKTIILVTHDLMLARNYCESLIYLQNGSIRGVGDPEIIGELYIADTMGVSAQENAKNLLDDVSAPIDKTKLRLAGSDGQINEICFYKENTTEFISGSSVRIRVLGLMSPDIKNPDVVIQVRDVRGYVLYGIGTSGDELIKKIDNDVVKFEAILKLDLLLAPGKYSLAVSLNDRSSASIFKLIDKAIGAVEFTIAPHGVENTHGCINLLGKWELSDEHHG